MSDERRRGRRAAAAMVAVVSLVVAVAAAPRGDAAAPDARPYGRPAITAPPRVHPQDPHRFAVGERVFYPVGHYGGSITATSRDWNGDVWAMNRAFLDALDRYGLNYARVWLHWGALPMRRSDWNAHTVHPWMRVAAPRAAALAPAVDGEAPFDLERFDDRHFELVANTLDYALERDIVLQLVLFDCWHLLDRRGSSRGSPSGVAFDPLHPRNNASGVVVTTAEQWLDPRGPAFAVHARYVRRLIESVGDRPNIVWEACNENSVNYPEFDLAIADLVTKIERELGLASHLVIPRDLPDHRRVAGQFTPARDRSQLEESLSEMRARLAGEQWAWNQPLVSDNDCCGDRGDPAFRRRKLWTALSAGAHVDFFVAGLPHDRFVLGSPDIARGLAFYGHVFRFLDGAGVDLVDMRPCPARGDGWALCRPLEADAQRPPEWIVYLPHGGRVQVEGVPSESRACWFDPRTAVFREAKGGPLYEAPNARDWVLHLHAAGGCPAT